VTKRNISPGDSFPFLAKKHQLIVRADYYSTTAQAAANQPPSQPPAFSGIGIAEVDKGKQKLHPFVLCPGASGRGSSVA
jgi:hypothetical protein